jgi:hypothetical protein
VNSLSRLILASTETLPEGEPITAKALLHLGNRAAVDQVLARLVRRGALMRAAQGLYLMYVRSKPGSAKGRRLRKRWCRP